MQGSWLTPDADTLQRFFAPLLLCEIAGCRDIAVLDVLPGNTKVIRVYERVGFVPRTEQWYAQIQPESAPLPGDQQVVLLQHSGTGALHLVESCFWI